MAEIKPLVIEKSKPEGNTHPLASADSMRSISESMRSKQELVPLVTYLKDIAGKPRGNSTGGKEDLNSHAEEFIVKDGEEIKLASHQQTPLEYQ